jgi:serine/threonine-protein kinase
MTTPTHPASPQAAAERRDPNLERAFGPWVAKRVLGSGGCGTAYYGVHAGTGAEVAIKVPHPHLLQNPDFLARFHREAAMGAVLDHPGIVAILDPGPPEGEPWLVMPFINGVTLEAYLQQYSPLPIPAAIRLGSDVAEAMAYAHTQGVVHRDLKPANIMVCPQGAVVMDLGIARILDSGKNTSVYMGTPTYSAPEAMQNPSVGPPADRYALGIILFEMLAGAPPFQADNAFKILEAHAFEPLPDLLAQRPLVPARLNRLIQRLCDKKPEERPEDGETLQILRALKMEFPCEPV